MLVPSCLATTYAPLSSTLERFVYKILLLIIHVPSNESEAYGLR